MNTLIRTLLEFDHCTISTETQYSYQWDIPHKIGGLYCQVYWTHPTDRKDRRTMDTSSIERLIAYGFVEVDNQHRVIMPTLRGYAVIKLYRGANAFNWLDYHPHTYKNWLNNANKLQRYINYV